jgi:CheY-like chemotaxis protein
MCSNSTRLFVKTDGGRLKPMEGGLRPAVVVTAKYPSKPLNLLSDSRPVQSSEAEPPLHPDTVDRHILVVDDERTVRELMVAVLKREGLDVKTAEDGYEAVDLVQTDASIALIILDWRMPGMMGDETLDQIVAVRPNVKIVVASGDTPSDVENAFCGRRVEGFVAKPFRVEVLLQAVRSALAA